MSETGVAREADVAKAFPVGADVEVVVLEVDPAGRRIRLSVKAVQDAQEAEEVRDYAAREDAAPTEGSDRSPTSCAARLSLGGSEAGQVCVTESALPKPGRTKCFPKVRI